MKAMLAAAIMATATATGATAAPARQAVDWTRTVVATPAGAYVMGNPRARVKLVEYLSLSCSHCAAFAAEGYPALKRDYVARGTVSLEVRNAVRDGFDLAAVMLSRCRGPAAFFPAAERILATQDQWFPKAQAWAQARNGAPPVDEAATGRAMAHAAGFDTLMQTQGLPPARVAACLADPVQRRQVAAMTQDAFGAANIPGTPAFLIDGVLVPQASNWAALQPKLAAAVARSAQRRR